MAEVFPCLHSLLDNMLKCNELYALLHPGRLLFSVVAPMYCCNTKENEESLAGLCDSGSRARLRQEVKYVM